LLEKRLRSGNSGNLCEKSFKQQVFLIWCSKTSRATR